MGIKKVVLNLILAVILALPLTAIENRYAFRQEETLTGPGASRPAAKRRMRNIKASPALVSNVGRKAAQKLVPHKKNALYDHIIKQEAESQGVSPALVKAVMRTESNFNPRAISPVGAVGLMQVLPETARRMGIADPLDPASNIRAGVRYLKQLLEMFEDDEALALAAYNSGPSKVLKYNGVPPIIQTRVFVSRTLLYYRSYLGTLS